MKWVWIKYVILLVVVFVSYEIVVWRNLIPKLYKGFRRNFFMKRAWIKYIILLVVLIGAFISYEMVLWRNLIPEYFFSIYSDKMQLGDMDVVVFLDKDVVPKSMHGYPVHFNVWVKGDSLFYKKTHSIFLERYFDVDAKDIEPYYEYFPHRGSVKFVSIVNGPRYSDKQYVHMLARNRDGVLFALTIVEKLLDSSGNITSECRLCFPEKESCDQIDDAKSQLGIKKEMANDLLLGEEIRQIADWHAWRPASCLDSLFKRKQPSDVVEDYFREMGLD